MRGVQVEVNVTLVPRITIDEYSLVGSGAAVTQDVPPYSLVVGNPGHVIKRVDAITCTTGVAPEGHAYHPYPGPDRSRRSRR